MTGARRPAPTIAPRMSLLGSLSDRFGDAFEALGLDRSFGEVVVSSRPDLAQFQCNGALPAAKAAGQHWAIVDADGRDLSLKGEAATSESRVAHAANWKRSSA